MWKPGQEPPPTPHGGTVLRGLSRVARAVAPNLVTWVKGMHPRLRVAWGSTEYSLRTDGFVAARRPDPGFEDNPRSNYNERLKKRQDKAAAQAAEVQRDPGPEPEPVAPSEPEPAPEPVAEAAPAVEAKPTLDLSEAALKAAVDQKMGIVDAADAEISRDPDVIKSQMVTLRAALQALDDVKDWDVVEGIDDELYQLHKAVEYKMRNHKASEAKSKLDDLFK